MSDEADSDKMNDAQIVPSSPGPVPDPGLEPYVERYSDTDPEVGRRVYRQIVTMYGLVPILAVAFVVFYFAIPRDAAVRFGPLHTSAMNLALGGTAGLAILLIGLASIHWAKQVMDDRESVDERHELASSPEDRKTVGRIWRTGAEESRLGRRKMIGLALGSALGALALPALVSLADLGPKPTSKLRAETIERTIWAEGVRLVNDVTFAPVKASDMEIGELVNAQPENLEKLEGAERQVERAKSSIIIVRMDPDSIKIPDSRKDWQVGGILSYSKICTHVGCPISLWEQQTHHLLCPCHQSTFDLGDSGVVVFGPAARALPQLPITVNSEGYLVARSDFTVPVGPSYFERDSRHDFKKGDN